MAANYTICVGTVGGGLSYSRDGGETWEKIRDNIPSEGNIRTMTVYPDDAHRLLAGTDGGVFRSEDNGASWNKLDSPFEDLQIWSMAVDPEDSDTIFAGTRPGGFRSRDGGKSWEEMNMGVNLNCPIGTPRTTNLIVDPRDHRTVWAGIEVDGVYKSLDGGDSWIHMSDLGPDPFHGDVHGMAIRPGPTTSVYATSPFGLATSTDEGESWEYHEYPKYRESDARSYCRGVIIKADDPDVMFVGHGNAIPGDQGAIQQTRDGGKTWVQTDLPVTPKLGGLLVRHPQGRSQLRRRRQPVRVCLSQRRRRRHLAQAQEGVRGNPQCHPDPQLAGARFPAFKRSPGKFPGLFFCSRVYNQAGPLNQIA